MGSVKNRLSSSEVSWDVSRQRFKVLDEVRMVVVSAFYGNVKQVFVREVFQTLQGMFEPEYLCKQFGTYANRRFEPALEMPLTKANLKGDGGERQLSFCKINHVDGADYLPVKTIQAGKKACEVAVRICCDFRC